MEPRNTKYMSLGDSRSLCMECLGSAVMYTGEYQPLYHSIRDFYEGMNMKLDQQIPMLLVERQALNEAMEGESKGPHHMPETRGLCLSEEQTMSIILRRPRIGRDQLLDMRTQPQKLTRRCEVTVILVLNGLPRLPASSILIPNHLSEHRKDFIRKSGQSCVCMFRIYNLANICSHAHFFWYTSILVLIITRIGGTHAPEVAFLIPIMMMLTSENQR